MNTEARLNNFLTDGADGSSFEDLSAAVLSDSRRTPVAVDDAKWLEHVRRYHGGRFDPRIDKCELYDRMKRAEEIECMLSPTDADGDGADDDYSTHSSLNLGRILQ